MLKIVRVTAKGDLEVLCSDINKSQWDAENDLSVYTKEAMINFFAYNKDAIFLACYIGNKLGGIASGVVLKKPYENALWLYVDEVDVAVPYRQKGVGKAMMQEFLAIAKKRGCKELWVGADLKNKIANEFYTSLKPDEVEACMGYAFKINETN